MGGGACDFGGVFEDEQVYFATDAEFWEVDTWLDGAAGVRDEDAVILGFVVVEVRAVGVDGGADAVAGTVDEVVGVASLGYDCAGNVVYLSTFDGLVLGKALAHEGDGGVSCPFDDLEDFALVEWDLFEGA